MLLNLNCLRYSWGKCGNIKSHMTAHCSFLGLHIVMPLFPVGNCWITLGKCMIFVMWEMGNCHCVREWDFSFRVKISQYVRKRNNPVDENVKKTLAGCLEIWANMSCYNFWLSINIAQLLPLLCLSVNMWQLGMSHLTLEIKLSDWRQWVKIIFAA